MGLKMGIFDKLFGKKAKQNKRDVISQDIAHSDVSKDSKIRIEYSECEINENNIDWYRKNNLVGGDVSANSNIITVYRYKIASSLNLAADDPLYKSIKCVLEKEPEIIAHEKKHIENGRFGNPIFVFKNYYELSALYAVDEISAYAAQRLIMPEPTVSQILGAFSAGIDDFIARKDYYVPRHISQVLNVIGFRSYFDRESTIKNIENLTPKYSANFHTISKQYFTFSGYQIFSPKNIVPDEIKQKMQKVKQIYEEKTKEALDHAIASLRGTQR